jgi:hypothetical protein
VRILGVVALLISLAAGQSSAPPRPTPAAPGASAPRTTKPATTAPDPDEGSIDNGVYTSDFFRFAYTLPEGFDVDEQFLADVEDQSNSTFVLLAAQGPLSGEDRRDMVVIMADREATTPQAYVQKVTNDYAQKQGFEISKPAYPVTIGGKEFYRADFRKEGTYQTAVFTVLNGYALGFTLAAPNQDAMTALVDSLNSVKFLPAKAPATKHPTPGPKTPAAPTKKAPSSKTP